MNKMELNAGMTRQTGGLIKPWVKSNIEAKSYADAATEHQQQDACFRFEECLGRAIVCLILFGLTSLISYWLFHHK